MAAEHEVQQGLLIRVWSLAEVGEIYRDVAANCFLTGGGRGNSFIFVGKGAQTLLEKRTNYTCECLLGG